MLAAGSTRGACCAVAVVAEVALAGRVVLGAAGGAGAKEGCVLTALLAGRAELAVAVVPWAAGGRHKHLGISQALFSLRVSGRIAGSRVEEVLRISCAYETASVHL